MFCLFNGCSSIKKLNLSDFSAIKVKQIGSMFKGCSSLKELDLSNFNTNDDPDMNEIFQGCFALKNLKCSDETIRKEFEKIKHY